MTDLDEPEFDRPKFLVGLIEDASAKYLAGEKSLSELSYDLDTLIDGLREVADPEWVGELKTYWGEIEIVNAVNLAADREKPTPDQDRRVREAIDELRAHVRI